jgi:YVTN family beta-propeller protein
MARHPTVLGAALALLFAHPSLLSATPAPLIVEAKIPLGDIAGRMDHLAFDPARQRLYVAELGNNTVGIVDAKTGKLARTVSGFEEPQGIAYEPTTDTVYVANAGDGSVRLFRGEDFAPIGQIPLGEDADNVRLDASTHRVYVGYGSGALAVINPVTRRKVAEVPLQAHPEGFQLDPAGDRVFVNVPDAGQIAVVSRVTSEAVASWPTSSLHANFPLALDIPNERVISIFRHPARLEALDMRTGRSLAGSEVCSDADDVFVDAGRHRVYVICGEGFVDTFDSSGGNYARLPPVATSGGSRTGLFVSGLDRLFVAIRASKAEPAAIWVLRAAP